MATPSHAPRHAPDDDDEDDDNDDDDDAEDDQKCKSEYLSASKHLPVNCILLLFNINN